MMAYRLIHRLGQLFCIQFCLQAIEYGNIIHGRTYVHELVINHQHLRQRCRDSLAPRLFIIRLQIPQHLSGKFCRYALCCLTLEDGLGTQSLNIRRCHDPHGFYGVTAQKIEIIISAHTVFFQA